MGNIIALDINLKSCLDFADKFIKEGKFLDAILNLNDAFNYTKNTEDKKELYIRYLYILTQTDNYGAAYTIFTKMIYLNCKDDFYVFDGIDVMLKNSIIFGDLDRITFEGLDVESREEFITARELYKNENFKELYEQIIYLGNDKNPYFNDMMKMVYESTFNVNFNLSKSQIIETATMLYAKDPENPYIISMLLDTKDKKIVELMEKGYNVQLENAEDDYFSLLHLGRAYMINEKYYIAGKFFNELLEQNDLDEEALFLATLNSFLGGEKEKAKRYLNTYAAVFSSSDAPINFYRNFFRSEYLQPTKYPFVSNEFVDHELERITNEFKVFSPNELSIKTFIDLFKVAGYRYNELYDLVVLYPCEIMNKALLELIKTMRVNSYHKLFLFHQLVSNKYEGKFDMIYKDKVYCGNLLKLRARGLELPYYNIYEEIVSMLPFCEEIIPMKCSVLSIIIKNAAKQITIEDDKELENITKYIIFKMYCQKLNVKIDSSYFKKEVFGITDNELLEQIANKII